MIPANCAPNGWEVHVTYILPQSEQMFKAIGHPGPWALRHGHHSLLSPGQVPRPRSSKGNCSPPLGEPLLRNPAVQSPRPYREEQVVPGGSREGLGSRASSHLWGRALKPPDVRSWEECPHIPPALSPAATAGRPRVAAGPAHSPARGARPETGWVCSLPTWLSPLPRAPGPWPLRA